MKYIPMPDPPKLIHPLDYPSFPKEAAAVQITHDAAVIVQEAGETLQIAFGFTRQLEQIRALTHPAIHAKCEETYECSSGQRPNKRWWQEEGITIMMDVPRDLIQLVPKCGYSYTYLWIAGQPVELNVSGGTPPPNLQAAGISWADWLGGKVHTLLNHPLETLKIILDETAAHDGSIEEPV